MRGVSFLAWLFRDKLGRWNSSSVESETELHSAAALREEPKRHQSESRIPASGLFNAISPGSRGADRTGNLWCAPCYGAAMTRLGNTVLKSLSLRVRIPSQREAKAPMKTTQAITHTPRREVRPSNLGWRGAQAESAGRNRASPSRLRAVGSVPLLVFALATRSATAGHVPRPIVSPFL